MSNETNEKKSANGISQEIFSTLIFLVFVVLFSYLVVTFVGQRTTVSGSSMENTLQDGDNLMIDKISYRFKDPERFDIIVFPPRLDEDSLYIKRIIGMPGETVQIDDEGTIYINGKVLDEEYGNEVMINPGLAKEPIVLSGDEYFVLGDNRNNSSDSRLEIVGNVRRDEIVGKAFVRIYPFNNVGILKHA